MTGSVLLRCNTCGAVNRVPVDKLKDNPKCGKCKILLEFLKTPIDVTGINFDKEVLSWPGAVLVEFWAPQCGHCRMIAPVVGELAHEKAGILKVVKVNIDKELSLRQRFGIQATPIFFFSGTESSSAILQVPCQKHSWKPGLIYLCWVEICREKAIDKSTPVHSELCLNG